MNDLHADLVECLGLVDRATSGEWAQAHRRTASDGYSTEIYDESGAVIATLAWHAVKVDDVTTTTDREANARAIVAALNLLRTHRDELLGVVEGWRPIETAPKDGTIILLAGGKWGDDELDDDFRVMAARWYTYRGWPGEPEKGMWNACCAEAGYSLFPYTDPTHWRPLPAPPAIDAARHGRGE